MRIIKLFKNHILALFVAIGLDRHQLQRRPSAAQLS